MASSSKRNQASVPVITTEKGYLNNSNSSDGESNDLPPFPATNRTYHFHLLNLLFIGDCGVGKTMLITRLFGDGFYDNYIPSGLSPAIAFKMRPITMDEQLFQLLMWDTSGHEGFRTTTAAYCRDAKGIFVVYDTKNEASFNNLHKWIREIEEHASPDVHRTLLSNKCDLKEEAEQKCEEYLKAKEFAEENGMAFFEVSARDSTNVELALTNMVARIWTTMTPQN